MNILLINSLYDTGVDSPDGRFSIGGVEYHRMSKPHAVLRRIYPEFDFLTSNDIIQISDEVLLETNLVIFSRVLGNIDFVQGIIDRLRVLGIPFALDLDDYWHLPKNHIGYEDYIKTKTPECTELSIKNADFIMCTTEILADKIRPINPNVHIIENAIDTEDSAWQSNKLPSPRLRFGFTQGNTHFHDIESISRSVVHSFSDSSFCANAQIVLTGFTMWDENRFTEEMKYEYILTAKHKALNDKQLAHDLKRNHFHKSQDVPYRRIYQRNVYEYPTIYDEIDISVVPIIENEFNSCKSELKMLEAAAKDCAVLIHHNNPYKVLATDKNSFDLNKKIFYDWQKYLLLNPNDVYDRKEQLKEDVKRYDIKLITEKRKQLYLKYKK